MQLVELKERRSDAYDIYIKKVSTLSYWPDTYFVTLNGRVVADGFSSIEEARAYINDLYAEKAA